MKIDVFNKVVREQLLVCEHLLTGKGHEYAPDAVDESNIDRLAHFKKAAAIIDGTPKEALLGMLTKHLVSISDMCTDGRSYSLDRWTEKITDSINYLLLLKALVEEEANGNGYGHCSTKKIWKSESDGQYEINIGAEFLNRPSANTAATMCHEMVHLYCLVNEIQDTCQKGRYHNKTFKAEAEARDLEIGYDRTVGFSHTNPTEAFKKTLEDNGFVLEVPFARVMPEEKAKAEREKPHRYVCPVCGQEVKTTADLSLICGICEVAMERAD